MKGFWTGLQPSWHLAQRARSIHRNGGFAVLMTFVLLVGTGAGIADTAQYVPGPGDVLDVEVYAAATRQEVFSGTVSPAGTISCPLIGEFAVAGQPLPVIATKLGEAFGNGYYVHPQVLINVRQYSGRVSMTGELRHPGVYPLGGGLTLLAAIELAGGTTDFAASHHVYVVRTVSGRAQRIEADLGRVRRGKTPDIPLQRDDRIEVPRRWF